MQGFWGQGIAELAQPWSRQCSQWERKLFQSVWARSKDEGRVSSAACLIFSARQHTITRYMPSAVRLSVRLSGTRVEQSKTVEGRITQPSPQSSPMTLVS